MKILKNRIFIASVCLVLAALLAFIIIPAMQKNKEGKITVLRVSEPIAKGETIDAGSLETVDMYALNLPDGIILDQGEVVGKVAQSNFYKGDFLFSDKLSSFAFDEKLDEVIAKGLKLITVTVQTTAAGLSGHLRAGDIVSIASYVDQREVVNYEGISYEGAKAMIHPELMELTIYSVENAQTEDVETHREMMRDAESSGTSIDPIPKLITLIVTPEQAVKLVEVEYSGKLHVVFEKRYAE